MTPPEAVFGQANLMTCFSSNGLDQLAQPVGVAVDANGTVWISDGNDRVLKFLNGQFLGNQPTADGLLGVNFSQGSLDLIDCWLGG